MIEDFDYPAVRRKLKRWFSAHARPLPWRESRDPYRIWVSEIMLQQTTVKAVIPYYQRFLERFPDVVGLASAKEADVLKLWEGLGYYSRGRNLRRAAELIVARFEGRFPDDLASLQSLPGVGRYTAGAIRSFAFDLPGPIVEANTLRLYCRLLNFDGDPRSREGQTLLWEFAERLQPARGAGVVNQALMELGATVCSAAEPDCDRCPLLSFCRARRAARHRELPRRADRAAPTRTLEATVAAQSGERLLVRQRNADERWAGMWDFPRFPIDQLGPEDPLDPRRLARVRGSLSRQWPQLIDARAGLLENIRLVTELRHTVTRYRIRLLCLRADVALPRGAGIPAPPSARAASASGIAPAPLKWVTFAELAGLPMPATGRKFANLLSAMPR